MKPQELIIPVRMDPKAATAALAKVGAAGKKAGDDVDGGAKKAKQGLDSAKPAADGFGKSLVDITKAQMGLAAIRATADAIGSAFNDTAKYVMESAKQFQELRKTMQEVATLKGSPNSNKFTLQEAQKAQQFHLSPQEYRDFQAEFMNYAGSQVGEGGKLTTEQGEEYAGRVAELMKGSGVNPAVGAELAGSLLENAKGPQDVEALMKQLGRTFNVLEKGRVPLKQALPQISQIMGHGISSEEAAKLFSIASPAAPGQEGNAVESALKAIEEMKAEGKGEDFGVKRGMGQYESVKAFAENLNKRKAELVVGGKTEQEATDDLAALMKEKGVAADIRERRGLVAGFARQGVELGGFKRYEQIQNETPEDFEAARKKRYEESEQGRQDAVDNAQAVANAKLGERNEKIAKFRQIAEIELTESGAFEQPNLAAGAAANLPGAADKRSILINQQAIRRGRAMLGEADAATDTATAVNQGLTDQLLREMLKRPESMDEETKKRNAERMGVGGPPGKSLSAPPPGGNGARQVQ